MKCSLSGQNTRVLAKAINSFSRIGHELYFEAGQNGLTIRTVNDSHTAFAVMTFETGFFTEFKIDRSSTDEFCNKCKVLMKSILGVFRNMRQVEKCQMSLNLKTSKLLFQFNCLFDTVKTHNVSILEQEKLNAVYMSDNPPNRMTAPNKMFSDVISNFRMYDNEITIEAADMVIFKNNIDMQTDKNLMRTKLTLKSQEFEEYHISEPTSITFCLKELRAILNFADSLSLDMTINFETAGRPVVFVFGSAGMFTANFVMSTLADDSSQNASAASAQGSKCRGNKRNDADTRNESTSKNLTLNLSEVIDLEADNDVPKNAEKSQPPTNPVPPAERNSKAGTNPPNNASKLLETVQATPHNPPAQTINSRRRSRSPNEQTGNNTQQGHSEGLCITFRPDTETINENADEEEVIPLSPQPKKRMRFKSLFPRLYQRTQHASDDRVLQHNSGDEL